MSFSSNYNELRKKRKKQEEKEEKKETGYTSLKFSSSEDIAPISQNRLLSMEQDPKLARVDAMKEARLIEQRVLRNMAQRAENDKSQFQFGFTPERTWFKQGSDNVGKAILGTTADLFTDLGTGLVGLGESAVDALAVIAPYFAQGQYYQNGGGYNIEADKAANKAFDEMKKSSAEFVAKDLYDEEAVAKEIIGSVTSGFNVTGQKQEVMDYLNNEMEADSVLGDKSDSLVQSAGALGGQMIANTILPGSGMALMGTTAFGSEAENALKNDATLDEAAFSGLVSAGSELLSERLGGISFGGKTVTDAVFTKLSGRITSKLGKALITAGKIGAGATAEGLEEVFSGYMSAIGQKLSYMEDSEIKELFSSDDALESFIGGFVLGGFGEAGGAIKSNAHGVDYVTGLTKNEQAVVDKIYKDLLSEAEKNGKVSGKEKSEIYQKVLEDLEKGYLDIDKIEEVLGGKTYEDYKATLESEDSILKEFESLYEGDELKRQTEDFLKDSKRYEAKDLLSREVYEQVKDGKLGESYRERARRSQTFTADLSQYDTKYHTTIQNAINSGTLNNTRRTHELVDMIAKISADKGVLFDFTNNEKIKGTSFAVEGKIVNGYVTESGDITLNVESPKYLNTTVGHEITHVLEGTEFYNTLQETIFEYAKSKNDYNDRLASLRELYKGVKGYEGVDGFNKIKNELTADLVGDYLFTDSDFVYKLSTEHRNIFQKIYDEIKYLYKVATAGSKEARQLEKVKKTFEEAYRGEGKAKGDTKYSLTEYSEQQKKNWSTSKRIVIYDNPQQLSQFIQDSVSNKTMDKKMYFGAIPSDLAARIQADAGVDVENYNLSLGSYEIRKILKDHGNEETESLRGQRAIVEDDFAHIVDVVLNPKNITLSEDTYMGKPAIIFTGEHNGRMNVTAVVSDKRLDLFVQTVYVNAKKRNLATPTGEQAPINTPEANSGTVSGVNVAQNGENVKYSLSDSDGKQLSKEQSEYFKDSKIRDANGSLMVMYHGTPNGDYTVFKDGTYFTPNKEYADKYQNPGASSLSVKQTASNPKTFEVYLDIKKPFDISNAEARRIYIEDYIKGGNAVGINPYLSDAEYAKIKTIDWTEGEDLREFLIENDYGYDGLVLDEGATGGYGDEVKSRGTSYVVFSPEQVKNVDNKAPTSDPDIRFSLSESVEETKDLIALHNLTADKLMKSLRLGGLPMPSVAIAKAKDGHGEFGEISIVLPKGSIDPQSDSRNKLYSGDAWTPTYPSVEYKPNRDVLLEVEDKILDLVPYDVRNALGNPMFDTDNARNMLDRYDGNMVEAYKQNDAMKYAFLKDTGSDISLPAKEADLYLYGGHSNAAVRYFSGKLVNGLQTIELYRNMPSRELLQDTALREAVADAQNFDVLRTLEPGSDEYLAYEQNPVFRADDVSFADIDNFLSATRKLLKNGVEQKVDRKAAKELIRDAVDQTAYESWLTELFDGVVEKEGIRNNKDYFTPSGNRRSFEALHYEHNLENVIKAMREQGEKGIGNGFGGASIFGASTTGFSSIEDMKRSSDRLQQMSYDEYQELRKGFTDRFLEIALSLPNEKNSFMATDSAAEVLTEAVAKYKTRSGIANYLKRELKGWATYSDQVVDDIIELVNDIRNMPTGYFEAKPQRAVGFDEVAVFIIPYDADAKLKQELLNRGYSIAEYDPKVEGDRTRVLNQFEEYKFSLSNVGEQPRRFGNFNISGKDVMLESAPVQETAPVIEKPVSESVAPVTEVTEVTDMFPDNAQNLDSLLAEQSNIRNALEYAASQNDIDTVNRLLPEYESVSEKVKEMQDADNQRLASLDDADVPPEMDAPYYGEPQSLVTPDDPFADRDWYEVGNQKVKSYMDENPMVKPFFQDEARSILMELSDTTKGERWYNDQLYYESGGEKGFGGVKRHTSDSIAELLDSWGMSYADIEKGLNEIIEDSPRKSAAAKKIEFMLNDRLLHGYKDYYTNRMVSPSQEYINLLNQIQTVEYSPESFDNLVAHADEYAPFVEDVAPVTKKQSVGVPIEDLAPTYDVVGKKGVHDGQQAFMPDAGVPKKVTRSELHKGIVDDIKSTFSTSGYDFDKVLRGAKNLSTFSTVDNTPQRVMEKALGYKEGGVLADLTVNKVAQNETEGIKWLNSYTDRKSGLLAKISKQYNIKPGSKESAAAQMYAEGFYVDENNDIIQYGDAELAKDFPNATVQKNIKGLAGDSRIRQIYDDTLAMINESRTRNAYPEIPRLDNYFLHFRAMEDTFSKLGLPFNPNDIRAKDLPTDLNGVTADLKPGQPYFASAMHRTGKRTSFDLLGGLERYLSSAKNQIYHIDDIQTLRALRNYIADTYGQANGLEGLDALSEEEAQDRIEKVYNSHLSTFAKFLNEEANILAGKTALIDRGLEGIIGRRGMTFLDTVNKQVGSNMVGMNVSSSLTNILPVVQTFAKTNKYDFVKAFAQTTANKVGSIFGRNDGFSESSPVIVRRKGADRFYRTPWQKAGDAGYAFMSAVDNISTELIARTKYNELTRKGMDSEQAHVETDKWVSRLMGDRSIGQMPQLYNSKMLGLFTKFQLEVRNQLDSQFYDTIQEAKVSNEDIRNGLARNAKTAAKVGSTFLQLAVAQHLFGKAFESVAGYNPAFDIIGVLLKAFGFDDDEDSEDTALDNIEQGFLELLGDLPYTSTLTGGRIPISSALPVEQFITGKDQYGNEKSRWDTLKEVAPYYLLPGGYGQVKKTAQGLGMFSEDHPIAGSYTDSGKLRFPVEDTIGNRVQAGIFGQWASENARDYFDNERKALTEEQIQELIDLDVPIQDYWEYREGLSGLKTLAEKADYIMGLDLPLEKKNLLVNNLSDREDPIDLEGYEEYGSFEDFDFAQKYPEKYDFLKEHNISVSEYNSFDEETKSAYTWASKNPEKYVLSQAVSDDFLTYYKYKGELNDIRADKDSKGDTIVGSAKEKKLDYINNLDLEYGQKIILFKSLYNADDTYNYEIIDYLNSREDIDYGEMETILKELGFDVSSDGTITWD